LAESHPHQALFDPFFQNLGVLAITGTF